jgi:hypothetical protein
MMKILIKIIDFFKLSISNKFINFAYALDVNNNLTSYQENSMKKMHPKAIKKFKSCVKYSQNLRLNCFFFSLN